MPLLRTSVIGFKIIICLKFEAGIAPLPKPVHEIVKKWIDARKTKRPRSGPDTIACRKMDSADSRDKSLFRNNALLRSPRSVRHQDIGTIPKGVEKAAAE